MKNPFRQLSLEEEIQIAIQNTKRAIVQLEIESIRHESNLAQMRRKLKYLLSQTPRDRGQIPIPHTFRIDDGEN